MRSELDLCLFELAFCQSEHDLDERDTEYCQSKHDWC